MLLLLIVNNSFPLTKQAICLYLYNLTFFLFSFFLQKKMILLNTINKKKLSYIAVPLIIQSQSE